jgi:hypothetical protein
MPWNYRITVGNLLTAKNALMGNYGEFPDNVQPSLEERADSVRESDDWWELIGFFCWDNNMCLVRKLDRAEHRKRMENEGKEELSGFLGGDIIMLKQKYTVLIKNYEKINGLCDKIILKALGMFNIFYVIKYHFSTLVSN